MCSCYGAGRQTLHIFWEFNSLGIINADYNDTTAHDNFVKNSITKEMENMLPHYHGKI